MAGPFENDGVPNKNRKHRITFSIGGVKTAAHVAQPTGSKERYEAARDDSLDPDVIQGVKRKKFLNAQTEEN